MFEKDEGYLLQCQLISLSTRCVRPNLCVYLLDPGIYGAPLQHQGFVFAGVIALIVLACYHQKISEGIWRVAFGLGIVLPLTIFFFRIRMINSTQYRKHAIKQNIPYMLAIRRYWKPMLGTCESLKSSLEISSHC